MGVWVVSLSPIPAYPGRTDSLLILLRIRSLVDSPRLRLANHPVALPQSKYQQGLYLNIFRGEPAISGFDRHITSNHSSSHAISPATGSGLPSSFDEVHPGHG